MRLTTVLSSLVLTGILLPAARAQTITTLQPGPVDGKDAILKSCAPCGGWNSTNYGAHQSIAAVAWTNSSNPSNVRALLQFDLSTIPQGAVVLDARLTLYHDPSSAEGAHSVMSGPNVSVLMRVTEAWDETTVTWDNQPATTPLNQVLLPASTAPDQHYPDIDVTALITDMLADPGTGHGFLLKQLDESFYRRVVFASSDHADAALHPKLVITHQAGVGMHEDQWASLSLHPNPAEDVLIVQHDGSVQRVELFDARGVLVRTYPISSTGKQPVALGGLSSGLYTVRLQGTDRYALRKLVVR